MGIDIINLFNDTGHVYVTNQGYVHIHFYTGDQGIADFMKKSLHGRVLAHGKVFDVVVSRKAHLETACSRLLASTALSKDHRRTLLKVLEYVHATNKETRKEIARCLISYRSVLGNDKQ